MAKFAGVNVSWFGVARAASTSEDVTNSVTFPVGWNSRLTFTWPVAPSSTVTIVALSTNACWSSSVTTTAMSICGTPAAVSEIVAVSSTRSWSSSPVIVIACAMFQSAGVNVSV